MENFIILSSLLSSALSITILFILIGRREVRNNRRILLDTSALMDGRIVEVVRSGFMHGEMLVPRFVIAELQLLADKSDHLKRERARFGLQTIQDLQDNRLADLKVVGDDILSEKGVDEKLVKLALKTGSMLYTTDFNLLKVAEIEGVKVLNINELAQNLRPTRLPGERSELKIVQRGQEKTQGVGYLDDGTMVVVDKAGSALGKVVQVEFTRTLQTAAGRMMFARSIKPRK